MCVAYDIELNDIVKFTFLEEDHVFYVELTNADNAIKQWVQYSDMLLCVIFLTH